VDSHPDAALGVLPFCIHEVFVRNRHPRSDLAVFAAVNAVELERELGSELPFASP
jgi:hypothetical protein